MRGKAAQGLIASAMFAAIWLLLHFFAGRVLDTAGVTKWLEQSAVLKLLNPALRKLLIESAWQPIAAALLTYTVAARTRFLQTAGGYLARRMSPARGKLINVPAPPPYFLPRLEALEPIREALLERGAARRVGIHGMGGTGKSVLAAAVAADRKVSQAFSDGVFWVALAQQADLPARQAQLCAAAGGGSCEFRDVQAGRARLSELLAGKACLLVLDDVWRAEQVAAFDVLAPRCAMLLTTRDSALLRAAGAAEHRLDVLDDAQSLRLLAEWAGQPAGALPREARDVVKECGNLPLALAMVGAMVRGKPDRWKNVLHKLRAADLEKVRQQFPGYPYPDLLKAIGISVEALAQEPAGAVLEYKERFLDFAAFPEDTPVGEEVIRGYWAPLGLSEHDVQDVLDTLVDKSLLRRDEANRLGLHDLHLDYVRAAARVSPVVYGAETLIRPEIHRAPVLAAQLLPDGRRLLTAFYDGAVRIWRVEDGTLLAAWEVTAYHGRVTQVVTNGRRLVSVTREGTARVWDVESGAELASMHGKMLFSDDENDYAPVRFTPDGRFAVWLAQYTVKDANGNPSSSLCVWDLEADGLPLRRVAQTRPHILLYDDIGLHPDSKHALTPSGSGALQLCDLESGEVVQSIGRYANPIARIAVSPDGRYAVAYVSGPPRAELHVWDLASGAEVHTLHPSTWVSRIAFTPDGRRLLAGLADGTLAVWDLTVRTMVRSLAAHTDEITFLQATSSGLVVSASDDGTLKVWDPHAWTVVASMGGGGAVSACSPAPDGLIAVGTAAGRACLFRPGAGAARPLSATRR